MTALVRAATADDLPAIAAIHDRAIRETAATWLWEPVAPADRLAWFDAQFFADRPVLVADEGGRVLGFASYGPFRAYHGYRDTVENSIYLAPDAQGRGLGRALLTRLICAARGRGVHVIVAAIALPNEASVGLHAALGFRHVGTMPEVGLKFGSYRDLCLMQIVL